MEVYRTPILFCMLIFISGSAISAVLYFYYLKNRQVGILKIAAIVLFCITVYGTSANLTDYIKITDDCLYIRVFSKLNIHTIKLSDIIGVEITEKKGSYLLRGGRVRFKYKTLIIHLKDEAVRLPENIFVNNSFGAVVESLENKGIKRIY